MPSSLLAAVALAGAMLVDRIVAVVDGRPVTLSDVRVVERVRGLDEQDAVRALVDERLMFREAARLPQAAATEDEVDAAVLALAPAAAATIPDLELRRLLRRQVTVLKYVDYRFRPEVRIPDEAVRAAWEQARAENPGAPPFEEAAPAITARLADLAISRRIEVWVKELRAAALIRTAAP
jgi:hypothetical protein